MNELAATTGAERAQALLGLTTRLTELIKSETALFLDRRPQDAIQLQDEKSKLANIYRTEVARAGKEPSRFSGATTAIKLALRQATETFHKALAENGHAVGAAKSVAEGVVKAIADEAAKQRTSGGGYGPGAAQSAASTSGITIAVNQTA
jgi:hypothetical protein